MRQFLANIGAVINMSVAPLIAPKEPGSPTEQCNFGKGVATTKN